MTLTVAASFGCPFEGEVDPARVADLVRRCPGAQEVALADTIGVGVPAGVRRLAEAVGEATAAPLRFHFHNTRNTGYANAVAALEAGAAALDASAGGIGGCPFAPAATGNIATEDLLYLLHRSGVRTGADLPGVLAAAALIEKELDGSPPSSGAPGSGPRPPTDRRGDRPALPRAGRPARTGARAAGSSVLAQQGARAVHPVVDAVVAQRHPPGRGVDGDDRLAQPALGLVGQAHHGQVGAALHERVHVRAVHLDQGGAQLGLGDVRDRHGGGAAQAPDGGDLEADLAEEPDHVRVAHRLVGVTTPMRRAPYNVSARSHASAPVAVRSPVMSWICSTNRRFPSTPPQNVSADIPITM
nr:hypothetical protein GCM10020093_008660 [Planobispora longispora]